MFYDEVYESPEFRKFKFRELKVYASTEWLADNKKKYRQVFDRYESAYMYAELSLYNKMYDLDDWDVEVELKCFSLKKGRTELCSLPIVRPFFPKCTFFFVAPTFADINHVVIFAHFAFKRQAAQLGTPFFERKTLQFHFNVPIVEVVHFVVQ